MLEASWGLGLSVVGGEVTPDRFVVDKVGLGIADRVVGNKIIEYRRGDAPVDVPAERRDVLCLQDDEVVALATLGKKLERIHQAPQDIEFAVDEELPEGSNLILLQCRPGNRLVQRQPQAGVRRNGGHDVLDYRQHLRRSHSPCPRARRLTPALSLTVRASVSNARSWPRSSAASSCRADKCWNLVEGRPALFILWAG